MCSSRSSWIAVNGFSAFNLSAYIFVDKIETRVKNQSADICLGYRFSTNSRITFQTHTLSTQDVYSATIANLSADTAHLFHGSSASCCYAGRR